MQRAYQYLKDMRPAISPNLNFMGQLIEFERSLELGNDQHSPKVVSSDPVVTKAAKSSPDVTVPTKVRQLKQGSLCAVVVSWGVEHLWRDNFSTSKLAGSQSSVTIVIPLADPNPGSLNLIG